MIKIEIERKSEKVITNLCHFVHVYCINEIQVGSHITISRSEKRTQPGGT